jgi:cholesterol transport system auxiliary component
MRKAALAVLAVSLAAACLSSPLKRYFEIQSLSSTETALPKIERRLAVEPPAVDPPYDGIRILFRVSPYEFRYYPYEFWVEKPAEMISAAMADFLSGQKAFSGIDRGPLLQGDGDLVLRSRVRALEEIDNPDVWQARLAMDLAFVDAKTGAVVLAWSFDRKGQMAGKKVAELPAVVSRFLGEELSRAVWELARALEKK